MIVIPVEDAWILGDDIKADIVIIQECQTYNAIEKKHQVISISNMIKMLSFAVSNEIHPRTGVRNKARAAILCHSPLKDYFAKYLSEPLPIESCLPHHLHEHLISEVASNEIQNIQESIDWITWTFMYRRLPKNPNYYEIAGRTS